MKVAVIGHRRYAVTSEIEHIIYEQLEMLINQGADKFCFAFKGAFFDVCHNALTEFKEHYDFKRVYYRAIYPDGKDAIADYLAKLLEQRYFDESIGKRGVDDINKRNRFMIDDCDVLLTLYDEHIEKSATAYAVNYARKKHKRIINVLNLI